MKTLIILFTFLLLVMSCNDQGKTIAKDQTSKQHLPDTAKIEEALRKFSALPPGTRGKAAILEAIRNDAIAIGYNEQACFLSMDLARGQIDRGNFDSALHYYNMAKPYCN